MDTHPAGATFYVLSSLAAPARSSWCAHIFPLAAPSVVPVTVDQRSNGSNRIGVGSGALGLMLSTAAVVAATTSRRRTCSQAALKRTTLHYSEHSSSAPATPLQLLLPRLGQIGSSLAAEAALGLDWLFPRAQLLRKFSSMPISVVDCGSGATRAVSFSHQAESQDQAETLSAQKSSWRGEPLALALCNEQQTGNLIGLLEEKLPAGLVLVGATAGVRDAVKRGDLLQAQLEDFASQLQDRLGCRASFSLLSGEAEARAEWAATIHTFKTKTAHAAASQEWPTELAGMLSGGGMSCQLAVCGEGGIDDPDCFSFDNRVLAPGGLAERAGAGMLTATELNEGLRSVEEAMVDRMAGLPRRLRGSFAIVEWVALFIASDPTERDRSLGLGYERRLNRQQIIQALDRHLQSLRSCAHDGAPVPRPNVVALVYGTVLRALFQEIFDDNADFICLKGVSWATGHYLLSRHMLA
mmetsp:Transcript_135578/g.270482  ORF Transcript_135578/g.270482 Transcript_135578/m.270482 type:complete len:468 (-) Transcript_135578:186-1589(-)